jgi:hypothetical protein
MLRRALSSCRAAAALAAAVFLCGGAKAQTVACSGPAAGNCVPVVQVSPGAGLAGFPFGATPVGNAFSGADTATAAATLPAAAGKFTYICGFTVSGLGATSATPVSVSVATLTGSVTPNYSYVFAAGAAVLNTFLNVTYSPCVPASAVNSTIAVTVPGAAGNTATQINAWGYQQ